MHRKITGRTLPSTPAVEAEAARIQALIEAASRRIESSQCNPRTFMHLQICRAELQAYFAGLLYGLGYMNLLDTSKVDSQVDLSDIMNGLDDSFLPVSEDDEDVRYIQFYEC
jgi:hypothetical protein